MSNIVCFEHKTYPLDASIVIESCCLYNAWQNKGIRTTFEHFFRRYTTRVCEHNFKQCRLCDVLQTVHSLCTDE